MSNARPRLSLQQEQSLSRLKGNPDFVGFRNHVEAELAYFRDALVTEMDVDTVRVIQGRVRQMQDLLKLMKLEG